MVTVWIPHNITLAKLAIHHFYLAQLRGTHFRMLVTNLGMTVSPRFGSRCPHEGNALTKLPFSYK